MKKVICPTVSYFTIYLLPLDAPHPKERLFRRTFRKPLCCKTTACPKLTAPLATGVKRQQFTFHLFFLWLFQIVYQLFQQVSQMPVTVIYYSQEEGCEQVSVLWSTTHLVEQLVEQPKFVGCKQKCTQRNEQGVPDDSQIIHPETTSIRYIWKKGSRCDL